MRLTLRSEGLPLAFLAATWALVLFYWPQLPDPIPTHWGPGGLPDSWMPKIPGAFIGPLVALGAYVFLSVLPVIDPRKGHWQAILRIYPVLKSTLMAFFALLTYLTLSAATRPTQALTLSWLLFGMGLMYMVLGNYLPTLRSNFFLGIRTPWTLSSEEVWYRTHRVAGRLMVGLGIVTLLTAFLPISWQLPVFLGTILLFSAWSIGYSYWVFRRLEG